MPNYQYTTRYQLVYPLSTASTNVPGDIENPLNTVDNLLTPMYTGVAANRPASGSYEAGEYPTGTAGRTYLASDTGLVSLDNGTSWLSMGPINGSAGTISQLVPGNPSGAGSTGFTADAAHTHGLPAFGASNQVQIVSGTNSPGTTGLFAQVDHTHAGVPVGSVMGMLIPSASPPVGWLFCNGATFSASTYPVLAALLGGNTLPNLQNVFLVGAGSLYTMGQTGIGNSQVALTTANLAAHTHTISGTHYHNSSEPQNPAAYQTVYTSNSVGPNAIPQTGNAGVAPLNVIYNQNNITGSASPGPTDSTGSGTAFSIIPPAVALNYYIKAL